MAGVSGAIIWCVQCVVMLSQDSFYRGLTPEELADVGCELAVSIDATLQIAKLISFKDLAHARGWVWPMKCADVKG